MNSNRTLVVCALVTSAFVSACANSPEEVDSPLGTARSAALNPNALNPNALNPNALNPNALNPNGLPAAAPLAPALLAEGPLSWATIDPAAVAALEDTTGVGDLARQLLKYTVGCAFDPTQSFDFTWFDAAGAEHDESYPGLLGLATEWAGQAPSPRDEKWVSACLISRANYLGVSVMLSSRGENPAISSVSESEQAAYPMEEGAFFGNVFTSAPTAYACDDVADDANSQSLDRFCAAGYPDGSGNLESCGIIQRLGSCSDYCTPLYDGEYHMFCATEPLSQGWQGLTMAVVTVFLP
jgi:hypothetical protein